MSGQEMLQQKSSMKNENEGKRKTDGIYINIENHDKIERQRTISSIENGGTESNGKLSEIREEIFLNCKLQESVI